MTSRSAALRRRASGGDGLFAMFASLLSTQAVSAVLGLAFWAVVARAYSATSVGVAAASIAGMAFVSLVGPVGSSTEMTALLRGGTEDRRLVLEAGLAVAGLVSLVMAAAVALVIGLTSTRLAGIGGAAGALALFVGGAAVQTVCDSFDLAVVATARGGRAQLVRNTIASALKIALAGLVYALGMRGANGIVLAWVVAQVVSFPVGWHLLRLQPHGGALTPRRRALITRRASSALQHHLLNLSTAASDRLLPLLVASIAAPATLAYFATSRLLFTAAAAVPYFLTASLYAAVAAAPDRLAERLRTTFPLSLAINAAIFAVLGLGAPWLLDVFGAEYAREGTGILRILLLFGFPLAVKDHFVVIRRIEGRRMSAAGWVIAGTCVELIAGIIGGQLGGARGVCWGWLAALTVEALVFLPVVMRSMRAGARPRAAVA